MNEINEKVALMFKRLKAGPDGEDWVAYLETLASDNHKAFLNSASHMNDIHKGYGICVDNLLKIFANCDKERVKTDAEQAMEEDDGSFV